MCRWEMLFCDTYLFAFDWISNARKENCSRQKRPIKEPTVVEYQRDVWMCRWESPCECVDENVTREQFSSTHSHVSPCECVDERCSLVTHTYVLLPEYTKRDWYTGKLTYKRDLWYFTIKETYKCVDERCSLVTHTYTLLPEFTKRDWYTGKLTYKRDLW